ncbi:hypothetical protein M2T59_31195, partial [Klebsiella pneumoniae]|nr:hypothetical protein [Klebsiella pneumoniae]
PKALCGWRYPLLIIAKGGSFSTVSTLRLYSSTSIACGFLYEESCWRKNSPATLSLMNKGNFLFNYSHYYLA